MADADNRPVPGLVVRLGEEWLVIDRVEAGRVYYAQHHARRQYPTFWKVEVERWAGMLARAMERGATVHPPEA